MSQGILERLPTSKPWIQRIGRILENHLHFPPPMTQVTAIKIEDIFPIQINLTRGGLNQPEGAPTYRGFP